MRLHNELAASFMSSLGYETFVNKGLSSFCFPHFYLTFFHLFVPLGVQNYAVKVNGTCNDLIESIKG